MKLPPQLGAILSTQDFASPSNLTRCLFYSYAIVKHFQTSAMLCPYHLHVDKYVFARYGEARIAVQQGKADITFSHLFLVNSIKLCKHITELYVTDRNIPTTRSIVKVALRSIDLIIARLNFKYVKL